MKYSVTNLYSSFAFMTLTQKAVENMSLRTQLSLQWHNDHTEFRQNRAVWPTQHTNFIKEGK